MWNIVVRDGPVARENSGELYTIDTGGTLMATPEKTSRRTVAQGISLSAMAVALLGGGFEDANAQAQVENPQIEEITITAQRREEQVQDVSMSLTAFDAEKIENLRIDEASDLGQVTPGLSVKQTGNLGNPEDPIFTIRGIGMFGLEANANPTVSVYVDDVIFPFFPMLSQQVFDVKRIEVLKGPQGTLYGRNNTGGAVNIVTRKPTQELNANMRLDFGRFDRFELEAGIGGGLTDTLAVRFATNIVLQDGWQTLNLGPDTPDSVDRQNGDVDRQAVRGSVHWEPTPNFDVLVTADAAWDNSEVRAFEHAGNNSRQNPNELCSFGTEGLRSEGPNGECGTPILRRTPSGEPVTGEIEFFHDDTPNDVRDVAESFSFGNTIDAENKGINVTANWDMDWATLTSVTGYRDFERSGGAGNGVPFVVSDRKNTLKAESVMQEFRFSSNEATGDIEWIAGLFFNSDEVSDDIVFDFQDHFQFFGLFDWEYKQDSHQIAPFANVTWHINDLWHVNAGLRFSHSDRSIAFQGGQRRPQTAPTPVDFFETETTTDDLSGTFGIDFTPTEDWRLYAKISKGFKDAGFPASIAFSEEELFPFDKETIIAYETGFKSTLLEGRLRFNVGLFYYDWMDFQAETDVERQGLRVIVLNNAGDARVNGLESEINWRPTNELTLNFSVNWMDADVVEGEFEGEELPQSPNLMLNGFTRWDSATEIMGVHPFAQFDFSFQSDVEFVLPNEPGANEEAFWLLNARAGFVTSDQRWEVAGWIRNLTDKTYRTDVFGAGSTFLPGRILHGDPRLFGGSVSYSF